MTVGGNPNTGTQPAEGALDALVRRAEAASLADTVRDLVLAACLGPDELAAAIGGTPPAAERIAEVAAATVEPSPIFLSSITVAGVRGIAGDGSGPGGGGGHAAGGAAGGSDAAGGGTTGAAGAARTPAPAPARLGLRPGPGLTLVVGRNGSGKSSFAEAAELALYGTSKRFEDREKSYERGWANLHHDGPRSVEVRLVEEGRSGETVLRRDWDAGAELGGGHAFAQRPGEPRRDPAELGLGEAIAGWRPFLSYNELGRLLDDGPARLYDSLAGVLGLEEWVEVSELLATARKDLEDRRKRVEQGAKSLRALLEAGGDERAGTALAALPARGAPGPDALATLRTLAGPQPAAATGLAELEHLAGLPAIDTGALAAFAAEIRAAGRRLDELSATDSARASRLASLLEHALDHHEHEGDGTCPVCGAGRLDAGWAEATREEVARLREAARLADGARAAWRALERRVPEVLASLPAPPPDERNAALSDYLAARSRLAAPAAPAASPAGAFAAGPLDALAAAIEGDGAAVGEKLDLLRLQAAGELQRRRDAWQPVAAAILAFLPDAEAHASQAGAPGALKQAGDFVEQATLAARNERFQPIKTQARSCWERLGQQSNVRLDDIVLAGAKTRRRVELGVSVDDKEGVALGVMSQGELHAMALSIFLPRAMLPENPFRFLIVDDPVQAMDALRVEGLAQVLAGAARTHQVVVLTHDARLVDAAERLDLGANVLEVVRGTQSRLTVRTKRSPATGYLSDARALLATEGCPDDVRARVVPGLCRNAVEAACSALSWQKLLAAGRTHGEIEEALRGAGRLMPRLAVALFGDAGRAGEVYGELNRRFGGWSADLARVLNAGAHGGGGTASPSAPARPSAGQLEDLVRDAERLVHALTGSAAR